MIMALFYEWGLQIEDKERLLHSQQRTPPVPKIGYSSSFINFRSALTPLGQALSKSRKLTVSE